MKMLNNTQIKEGFESITVPKIGKILIYKLNSTIQTLLKTIRETSKKVEKTI